MVRGGTVMRSSLLWVSRRAAVHMPHSFGLFFPLAKGSRRTSAFFLFKIALARCSIQCVISVSAGAPIWWILFEAPVLRGRHFKQSR
jgi:hypothetical protein